MSKSEIDQLVESLNQSKAWEASLFDLVLLQEFRHWREVVESMEGARNLDAESRDRVAATSTVDIVLHFFHDEHRAELAKVKDQLIARLLKWNRVRREHVPTLLN